MKKTSSSFIYSDKKRQQIECCIITPQRFFLLVSSIKEDIAYHMNEHYLESMGQNIRKARKAKGLSLRQLSTLCASDHSDISRIEKGKINIGVLKLIELSRALDLHPRDLLDFEISPLLDKTPSS